MPTNPADFGTKPPGIARRHGDGLYVLARAFRYDQSPYPHQQTGGAADVEVCFGEPSAKTWQRIADAVTGAPAS